MKTKKRHWALAGLVLALGTAVYLNWQFSPSTEYIDNTAKPVASEEEYWADAALAGTVPSDTPVSAADTVQADTESSDIEQLRAERTTSREDSMSTLKDIIDNASLSDSEKAAAVETLSQITKRMEAEASIETLIKAKGFKDCVVVISDSQINVILPASEKGIDAATTAIIQDIVMGQTEFSPSAIKIIESK